MRFALIIALVLSLGGGISTAASRNYVPLVGIVSAPDRGAYVPLNSTAGAPQLANVALRTVKAGDRPILPGQRPLAVELLEDALRRKQPRTIGDSQARADEAIIRNALRDPIKRAHIRGQLAEARFLYENPEWGYVRSPTAPQVDVYRWQQGTRKPVGAQIKTHATTDPTVYARDMLRDNKADLFLVPDEHVDGLRNLWRKRLKEARGRGAIADAVTAEYHLNRVRGLGFSTTLLDDDVRWAASYLLQERKQSYVSLGAGRALFRRATGWEFWRDGKPVLQSEWNPRRIESVLAGQRAETVSIQSLGSKGLRVGRLIGIWAPPILIVADMGVFIYENGGREAFGTPGMYIRLGGDLGALIAIPAMAACYSNSTVLSGPMGPMAPAIGTVAGLLCGGVAGVVGYLGGEVVSRKILEIVSPELIAKAEKAAIDDALSVIEAKITLAQREE